MIIEIVAISAAVIAIYVAFKKHKTAVAVTASAVREAAIVKSDIKAAVTKTEATVTTIKADLAKYL